MPEVLVSTDDMIDEAFDYLRSHPRAKENQVRQYLEDLVSGRIGRTSDDQVGKLILFGPLFLVIESLFASFLGRSHSKQIDDVLRVVFPKKKKKRNDD